jgi:hypothetical protein
MADDISRRIVLCKTIPELLGIIGELDPDAGDDILDLVTEKAKALEAGDAWHQVRTAWSREA